MEKCKDYQRCELHRKNKHYKERIDKLSNTILDVEIMLDQLKMMFGLEEKTKAYRKYKIKRMVERIGDNG